MSKTSASLTSDSYYPSFLLDHIPHFHSLVLPLSSCSCRARPPLLPFPPSSFLKATCSQPVWLSCTLPMKGFLLGWDWVQPSRAWPGLGARLALPQAYCHPPPSPNAQPSPHACSGLALLPRRRLLVSAVLNCRQQLNRARKRDIVERGEEDSVGLLNRHLTSMDSKVLSSFWQKSWLSIRWFY